MGRFFLHTPVPHHNTQKGEKKTKKKKADYFWALICPLKKDLRQGSPFL